MPEELHLHKIDPMAAILAVNATLRRIDERLIDHGERVAYIAYKLNKAGNYGLHDKELFLLSVFHDIGAYKTEEIDRMLEFETDSVQSHSVYGYLFLKYLTPLRNCAEAILYHHTDWAAIQKAQSSFGEYAAMIHLADRIDVAMHFGSDPEKISAMLQRSRSLLRMDYLETAIAELKSGSIPASISDGSYHAENIAVCSTFHPSAAEALEYLKMVVYSIDFRSDNTVTHTINTIAIALNIARHFHLPDGSIEDIYLGALLHDIGKIAIPLSILESPGRLNDADMAVMRTHVVETEHLIKGIVPDDICQLALRHHEKLDGSGYPQHLTGEQLTFPERIIAVADIVSALSSRRSYKEPFPKDKTLMILQQMSVKQLDPQICRYVIDDYDHIMTKTDSSRQAIIDKYRRIQDEHRQMTGSGKFG